MTMLHVFGNSNPRSILYIRGGVALSSTLRLRPEGSKVEGKLPDIIGFVGQAYACSTYKTAQKTKD